MKEGRYAHGDGHYRWALQMGITDGHYRWALQIGITDVAVVLVFTTAIPGDSTNGGSPVGVATANKTQIPRCCPSICIYLFTLSGTKFMHQGVSSSPVMVRDSRMICDYAYGLGLE